MGTKELKGEELLFWNLIQESIKNKTPIDKSWIKNIKEDLIPYSIEHQVEDDRVTFTTENLHNGNIRRAWTYLPDFRVYCQGSESSEIKILTIECKGQVVVFGKNGFGSNIEDKATIIDKLIVQSIKNGSINWNYIKLKYNKRLNRFMDWHDEKEMNKETKKDRASKISIYWKALKSILTSKYKNDDIVSLSEFEKDNDIKNYRKGKWLEEKKILIELRKKNLISKLLMDINNQEVKTKIQKLINTEIEKLLNKEQEDFQEWEFNLKD